jgi:vacuolar-type H+-ATPase subunit D/Vma8
MKWKQKKKLKRKRQKTAARFVQLENRLRRLTTDAEIRVGEFARSQSRELAKETNKALREYQKAHKAAQKHD